MTLATRIIAVLLVGVFLLAIVGSAVADPRDPGRYPSPGQRRPSPARGHQAHQQPPPQQNDGFHLDLTEAGIQRLERMRQQRQARQQRLRSPRQ
ncbi:hypothetical protein DFJ73DRAFT_820291 [Zopfochytrium polystomum]|nr:hypothetical protein DFJ73DRAFT_820291 [Zopfochytrium polystomum]